MIGEVQLRRADVALTEITINDARSLVVDFTWPYMYEAVIFISSPPTEKSRAFVVLQPLDNLVRNPGP